MQPSIQSPPGLDDDKNGLYTNDVAHYKPSLKGYLFNLVGPVRALQGWNPL